jgi:hypothetical protein
MFHLISRLYFTINARARNHEPIFENGWTNSVWDMTMYDMAQRTENLTFYLNTSILDVRMASERKIASVVGYVANAEMEIELVAPKTLPSSSSLCFIRYSLGLCPYLESGLSSFAAQSGAMGVGDLPVR